MDPSVDRSIKIVRQLEPIFEPYSKMFIQLKGKKEAAPITMFLQRKKNWGGGTVNYSWIRAFREGVLEPIPQEKQRMSVFSCTGKKDGFL